MSRSGILATLLLACVAAVALSACRNEEQHRNVSLHKGTYQGEVDSPLDPKVAAALHDRVKTQSF